MRDPNFLGKSAPFRWAPWVALGSSLTCILVRQGLRTFAAPSMVPQIIRMHGISFTSEKRAVRLIYWCLGFALILSLAVLLWEYQTVRKLHLRDFGIFITLFSSYMFYGKLALDILPFISRKGTSLPLLFVLGFFVQNTLLFVLFCILPLPIGTVYLLSLVILLIGRMLVLDSGCWELTQNSLLTSWFLIIVTLLSITFLCRDWMRPIKSENGDKILHTWPDSYVHSRYISSLVQSNAGLLGVPAMDNAFERVKPYHYAVYIPSVIFEAFSKNYSYDIFRYLFLPLSIILLSCGLYSLLANHMGAWCALLGGTAYLLLPDAYYQGMGNKFYSFAFFECVSPGLPYGMALAALGWALVLRGVKTGYWKCVLIGWLMAFSIVFYKAQLFVAIVPPILFYPVIFYPKLRLMVRIVTCLVIIACSLIVVSESQKLSKSIPTLRLDGSGVTNMMNLYSGCTDNLEILRLYNACKDHVHRYMKYPFFGLVETAGMLGPMGLIVIAVTMCRKRSRRLAVFPLFCFITFYVMSLGLAMNDNPNAIGTEELLHRPFVWVYIIVFSWMLSSCVLPLFRPRIVSSVPKYVLIALIFILLPIPYHVSRGLQTMPAWKQSFTRVPNGLFECCDYLRHNTGTYSIVLDSEGDSNCLVSGLAERQDFRSLLRAESDSKREDEAYALFQDQKHHRDTKVVGFVVIRPSAAAKWSQEIAKGYLLKTADGYYVLSE